MKRGPWGNSGNLNMGDAQYIEWDAVPLANLTGSGEVTRDLVVATNTVGITGILHIHSDGTLIDADSDGIATMPVFGMALQAGTGNKIMLLRGFVRNDSWTWTVGGILWASGTVGQMTQTEPSAGSSVSQALGIATHADRIYFNPSAYVEIN